MTILDPVGDLIARIKNAQLRGKDYITCPYSKLKENILFVLKYEGYISSYESYELRQNIKELKVELKYSDGLPVIQSMKRVSRPGRRSYVKSNEPSSYNGLGTIVLTTSKGVMSDAEARKQNVGGEALLEVF